MGRKPWQNLKKTVAEMSEPSFLRVWFGDTRSEVRDQDGKVLRVDDQQVNERRYLAGVGRALWTTLRIATLGTALAALIALPLGLLAARTLHAPRPLFWLAKTVLDSMRSCCYVALHISIRKTGVPTDGTVVLCFEHC